MAVSLPITPCIYIHALQYGSIQKITTQLYCFGHLSLYCSSVFFCSFSLFHLFSPQTSLLLSILFFHFLWSHFEGPSWYYWVLSSTHRHSSSMQEVAAPSQVTFFSHLPFKCNSANTSGLGLRYSPPLGADCSIHIYWKKEHWKSRVDIRNGGKISSTSLSYIYLRFSMFLSRSELIKGHNPHPKKKTVFCPRPRMFTSQTLAFPCLWDPHFQVSICFWCITHLLQAWTLFCIVKMRYNYICF